MHTFTQKTLIVLRWMFRSVVTIVTVAIGGLLVLSAMSQYVDPQEWCAPQLLGVAFGILALCAGMWELALLVLWRWRCAVGLGVVMLMLWSPLARICPMHLLPRTAPSEWAEADTLHLLTYNTRSMGDAHLERIKERLKVVDVIRQSGADVVCLQEFAFSQSKGGHTEAEIRRELSDLYPYYDFRPQYWRDNLGVAIFSKLPIRLKRSVDTRESDYFSAQYYQLTLGKRDIGLVNIHLRSNNFDPQARVLYDEMLSHFSRDSIASIRHTLIEVLMGAWRLRSAEAHKLSDYLAEHHPADMPLIICGDMNDTPLSHVHYTLRNIGKHFWDEELTDTWRQAGSGPGITYHEHRFWFRIDHILTSPHCWTQDIKVLNDVPHSDHYPVQATLMVKKVKS